ncbi:MAG: S9 family peptidase [Pseudomonadales bacterium]
MRYLLAGLMLVLSGACSPSQDNAAAPEPAAPVASRDAVPRYSARQFFTTVSIRPVSSSGFAFSPDDARVLITSDASGVYNSVAVELTGGAQTALTSSASDGRSSDSYFPAEMRVLVTGDSGGDERYHLFVRELDGSLRDLTPGENVRAQFLGWADDAEALYVLTNERDPAQLDLYRYRTDDYGRTLLFENDEALNIAAVSGDGRWVAAMKTWSNDDRDLLLVDLQAPDHAALNITPGDEPVSHIVYGFTPDSRALIFGSNAGREFYAALRHDLLSGEQTPYLSADWDVAFVSFSSSGRYRVWGVNADARTRVQIDDLDRDTTLDELDVPPGDLAGVRFDRAERQLAFLLSSDTAPPNLYLAALDGKRVQRLTDAANPAIDESMLVSGELVRYPSYDGLEIPGILYRPREAAPAHPVPALVWVHGGPGGQSRLGYNPTIQHLVNHGYAVLAANHRGSSGYGKTFYHLDDRRHGEADLDDIVEAKGYLADLPWIDGARIGVAGGSYGGYMTAAALAFRPDVFDVGIDIFGVTNWVRTLSSIPEWWETQRASLYAELGDPATDADRLRRISPLFHAQNISRPLLVVQGANDPRVLRQESDELVAAVRRNGVPVDYLVFPDEGHGFSKRENRIAASEAMLRFLDEHL